MATKSDKESAAFWKDQAKYLEQVNREHHREAFDALRALCRTLGIRHLPGNSVVDCIKGIDAEMKNRLTGR